MLEEIIKSNPAIKVIIIFTASNDKDDERNKPVKHLLAIAAKENLEFTTNALDDWYLNDQKKYEIFAAKYPMNGELKAQDVKIEMMSKWCDDAEITTTPTFFINGKRLPEAYNFNELKNII